jgi:hypothetical protein
MSKVITNNFRLNSTEQLLESISEPANTTYYLFTAKHTTYGTSGDTPTIPYDTAEERNTIFKDMVFGKRVSQSDVSLMIPRSLYVANTLYNNYDDQSNSLFTDTTKFYATVQSGSYYHTFKCLNNNNGNNSTVAPSFSTVDPEDEFIITSDNYVWKYMYSISDTDVLKFGTSEYFPVVSNSDVTSRAKPGTIDVIKVITPGQGYDNYLSGTFGPSDIRIGGSDTIYGVTNNSIASSVNGYYTGCLLKIVDGTGTGQYKRIVNYVKNTSTKAIFLETGFTIVPTITSKFEITPEVLIASDGFQTVNAIARATVNATSNTIESVEMLSIGSNYRFASASVIANAVVGVTSNASVRPILAPELGHGHNSPAELGASRICFSVSFANTEGNTIPTSHEYRQIGLLKDPVFAYATFDTDDESGNFSEGERVLRIKPVRIFANAAVVNTTSSIIAATNADFVNQFEAGDYIYLKSASQQQIAVVNSITNSTQLVLKSTNGLFACTTSEVYKVDMSYRYEDFTLSSTQLTGTISVNTTSSTATGTSTLFQTELRPNSYIVVSSNGTGYSTTKRVVSITSNTVATLDSNNSFANSLAVAARIDYNYTANTGADYIIPNAIITAVATGQIEVANVGGIFQIGDLIVGEETGAIATINTVSRAGISKGFNTFVQMNKYVGSLTTGTFDQDELVYQGSANTNYGLLHSVEGATDPRTFYITNLYGTINTGGTIIGSNSGAIATITTKYNPELVFNSGEVMYIENLEAVARSNNQTETFKLIFEF